jgi:hypothetical protein
MQLKGNCVKADRSRILGCVYKKEESNYIKGGFMEVSKTGLNMQSN